MSLARIPSILAAAALFFTGCASKDQDLDALEVTRTTKQSVEGHLTEISDAIELVAEAPFFTDLGAVRPNEPLLGLDREEIGEIVAEINTRIFHESAIESESDTEIVYRLRGHLLCDGDTKCRQAIDKSSIRLVVTSPAEESLDIAVLVGIERYHPFTLHLSPVHVSAAVFLADVKKSVQVMAPELGLEEAELPQTVRGVVRAVLSKVAEREYIAELYVDEAVDIDGGDRFSLQLDEQAGPIAKVNLDGLTPSLYAELALSSVDASLASSLFLPALVCGGEEENCGPFTHRLTAHLAGATASFELVDTLDRVLVRNVGLGQDTSSIKLGETELLTVDINQTYDRVFDVELAAFDNFIEAKITEAFTLDLGLDLDPLRAELPDLPEWTGHDTIAIHLEDRPKIRAGEGDDHVIDGRSVHAFGQVLSGQVRIDSEHLSAPIELSTGECLYVDDSGPSSAHPFSSLLASSCP